MEKTWKPPLVFPSVQVKIHLQLDQRCSTPEPSCPLGARITQRLLLGSQGSKRTHNKRTHRWSKAPHTFPPPSAVINILFLLDGIKTLLDNPDLKDSYTSKIYLFEMVTTVWQWFILAPLQNIFTSFFISAVAKALVCHSGGEEKKSACVKGTGSRKRHFPGLHSLLSLQVHTWNSLSLAEPQGSWHCSGDKQSQGAVSAEWVLQVCVLCNNEYKVTVQKRDRTRPDSSDTLAVLLGKSKILCFH